MTPMLRALLREPTVQFLAAGAGLFLLFQWGGPPDGEAGRIIVGASQIEHLTAGFTRMRQRPPTEGELEGLVDDHVREEIAAREARRLGLDRDDTLIRRRLRQKLEFLVEDDGQTASPSDAELQAWLDAHADAFRRDPEVAFRHVFVSGARRGGVADGEAQALLARLTALGPGADVSGLGDPLRLLPDEIELTSRRDVAGLFGERFADRVLGLPPGRWAGPVESGYGVHLVLVTQRTPGRLPALGEVREQVVRDVLGARRAQRLEAMYQRLLERHPVIVERPTPASATRAATR
jgi:PPIC-type PPIASE domain